MRIGTLLSATAFALLPLLSAWPADGAGQGPREFRGKVVPLADVLASQGIKLDADAGPTSLVLVADDGRIYPLVKDAGSRMFHKDARLRNRPMALTGQLAKGSELLQVVSVRSVKNGRLHDVFYWCDVCAIKTFEAGVCDCCGAPMELRETPAK